MSSYCESGADFAPSQTWRLGRKEAGQRAASSESEGNNGLISGGVGLRWVIIKAKLWD